MMEAYILEAHGSLKKAIINTPIINPGEVLINTKAIGINPIDIQVRNSREMLSMITGGHVPEQVILGWDVAGIVEQVGEGVEAFKPGDAVYGLVNMPGLGSTYATQLVAPAEQLVMKPEAVSFTAAGATPMAAMTAWQAVVTLGKVQKGERMLIHAAAGGVGHFAVQLAKERGAYVIGTASAKNEGFVRSLGVDEFVDYTSAPFETFIDHVDVVVDTINAVEHVLRSVSLIKKGGRLVYLQPHFAGALQAALELAGVSGFGVFVHSSASVLAEISRLIQAGKISPQVSQVFSFDQLADAQAVVATGRAVGKIVVAI